MKVVFDEVIVVLWLVFDVFVCDGLLEVFEFVCEGEVCV